MRWLKHLSCAHRDEKVTRLISECGLEGYGFFWVLCEVVAEGMDKSDRCELTHPLPQWSHLLHSHHNKVSKYLGKLQVIGLCNVSEVEGSLRVAIPKLLKYRDEYASRVGTKSGQNRDSVPSKKSEAEADTETHHSPNGEYVLTPFPQPGRHPLGEHVFAGRFESWFEQEFWPAYPRKVGKAAAKKVAKVKMRSDEVREQAMRRLQYDSREWLTRPPEKRPHAATWLNTDRWADPIEADPPPREEPEPVDRYRDFTPPWMDKKSKVADAS